MWVVGFVFIVLLAIFLAPIMVEGAIKTGINIGQVMSEEE